MKPASFGCNLRCEYCFYLCKKDIFRGSHMMSGEVLERMISSFLKLDMPVYSFGWQGGEPTLMGLDFFRKATEFQQKYGRSGQQVSNGLQTNGTLLNDEWCRHLAEYNFLVGLSIDGPPEIHDKHRLTADGRGSHSMVMKGMDALKRNRVEFNVLTLVSDSNAESPLLVYNYLKNDLGVKFHQYIECVEFDENGELHPYAVRPEQWGEFLCRIFDEWYKKDRYEVSVRLFDSILFALVEGGSNTCVMGKDCRQYLVVEHNGDIYPCDFFVLPELKLGNIMDGNWKDFLASPIYQEFGKRKAILNERCSSCPYLDLCAGCCPKNRSAGGRHPEKLSALCRGWEIFYEHTLPRFRKLAADIIRQREDTFRREQQIRMNAAMAAAGGRKISRNAPCPCGSGKKFKRCCGK